MDMVGHGRKYFEASFVRIDGGFRGYAQGRAVPIVINWDTMRRANSLLVEKAGAFVSNWSLETTDIIDEFYLLDGAVVEVNTNRTCPQFMGILHETEIGVAYVVNQLELPTNGPRWPS